MKLNFSSFSSNQRILQPLTKTNNLLVTDNTHKKAVFPYKDSIQDLKKKLDSKKIALNSQNRTWHEAVL